MRDRGQNLLSKPAASSDSLSALEALSRVVDQADGVIAQGLDKRTAGRLASQIRETIESEINDENSVVQAKIAELHALKQPPRSKVVSRVGTQTKQFPIPATHSSSDASPLAQLSVQDRSRLPKTRDALNWDLYELKNLIGAMSLRIPIARGSHLTFADVDGASLDITNPRVAETLGRPIRTGILAEYGVRWSLKKIARDILQNFYDGHNQTLEGVEFRVSRQSKDKDYEITIEGGAEYPTICCLIWELHPKPDRLIQRACLERAPKSWPCCFCVIA